MANDDRPLPLPLLLHPRDHFSGFVYFQFVQDFECNFNSSKR